LSGSATAEPIEAWTPAQVLQRVASEHPAVQAALLESESAYQYARGAGAQPNPTVRLALTRGDVPEDANSLTQRLEIAGQTGLRKKIAGGLYDQAEHRRLIVLRTIALQALYAYYDLWSSRRRVEMVERIGDHSRRLEKLALIRMENGEISQDEYRRAKLQRVTSEANLAQARTKRAELEVRFRSTLGLTSSQSVELPLSPLPPTLAGLTLPQKEDLLRLLEALPDVKLAQATAKRKELEAELAGREGAPDLFFYAYRADYSSAPANGIQVGFSFPLLDWGQLGAEVGRKRALAEAAAKTVESEKLRWRSRILESWEAYQGRAEQLDWLYAQSQELEVLAAHSLLAYEVGFSSLLEVLTAQNDYQKSLINYLEASATQEKQKWEIWWLAQGTEPDWEVETEE
jgi:outer membrane protein TolC